jgi:hypothetical protein
MDAADMKTLRNKKKPYLCRKTFNMYWQGILIGLLSFLIIGLFHPLVVKAEYYIGKKAWWGFLAAGLLSLGIALCISDFFWSALCGVLGFSCLWSIREMFEQEERVKKGWFPANPKKKNKAQKQDRK